MDHYLDSVREEFVVKHYQFFGFGFPVVVFLHCRAAAPAHGFGFIGMVQNPLHGAGYGLRVQRVYQQAASGVLHDAPPQGEVGHDDR